MSGKVMMGLAGGGWDTPPTTTGAAARGGGGGGHGGGGGGGHGGGGGAGFHGGGGFGGGGSVAHAAFGHPGNFTGQAAFARPVGVGPVAAMRPVGLQGGRIAFAHRIAFGHQAAAFRHHLLRNRFAVFGAGYPFGYYDNCYERVWTQWGWQWQYVCY
jgi:hypothetical protein